MINHIDAFMQDCSISIATALEILQSCSKPSIYYYLLWLTGNRPAGIFPSPAVANLNRWSPGRVVERCWAHLSREHVDGLVQERYNSNALAMELRLSFTNPLMCPQSFIVPGSSQLSLTILGTEGA